MNDDNGGNVTGNDNDSRKRYSFSEIAKQLGRTEEEIFQCAYENGLIDENGNPTEFAIKEGLLTQTATVEDEYGDGDITVSNATGDTAEGNLIAVDVQEYTGEHENNHYVLFLSREKAYALGEVLIKLSGYGNGNE